MLKDDSQARSSPPGADNVSLHPLTRCWEVPKPHVTIEKIIGKGAFGQVAKGTAVGLRGSPETTTVAIKMLKSEFLYCKLNDSLGLQSFTVTGLPQLFSYLSFDNLCRYFDIFHIIPVNQILLLVFNAPANATESDKRDLMKELDTMKQLKPHPYVIKLLGCVTESGMLWLCGSNFAVHIFLMIYFVTLSRH